jgi:hypothetical protein
VFENTGCTTYVLPTETCYPPKPYRARPWRLIAYTTCHAGHGLATGVLSVGHRIADYVLEEHREHTAGLLVDETVDALHATATTSQSADGGLGDTLDVVAQR